MDSRQPHESESRRVYGVMEMHTPFEIVVRQHGATVLRVCRAILGAGADAEDAWSETFLAALRAWPRVDAAANIEAYLVRIAQRKALDIARSRARQPIPTDELPEQACDLGGSDTADGEVWAMVALLPDRQRQALAFHYLGELSHVETARLIGGTPDSVRRAAADGMRTLRRMTGADTAVQRKIYDVVPEENGHG